MAKGGKELPHAETATRVRLLRESMGYQTSNAFAAYLGVSAQRWNNVEIGMPLSRDMAFLLVRKVPGLSLDWLYFGNAAGLPLELAKRLGALGDRGSSTTRA